MNRDALWSGLEALVAAILSIVTPFVVARLIGPSELGIGAAATAVHVILWVVVNGLFADALVQRAAVNDRMLSSAFWASVAVGVVAMAVQAAAGWGLAFVLDDRRLVPMTLVLAAALPFVGAGGIIQGLLTRERACARLALRTIFGQGLGTAVGVLAALAGAGAWALVAQQAVTSVCGALILLRGRGWTPPAASMAPRCCHCWQLGCR
jgi:O-antigen/teichoic acid export membrane protein